MSMKVKFVRANLRSVKKKFWYFVCGSNPLMAVFLYLSALLCQLMVIHMMDEAKKVHMDSICGMLAFTIDND